MIRTEGSAIFPLGGPRDLATVTARPPGLFLPEPKAASERFWEFFTANIRNGNTQRAYYKAACRFSGWCEDHGLHDLARVKPIHVATFIEELLQELSKPTVKQHLAALRMLFDWLVVGHIIDIDHEADPKGPLFRTAVRKSDVLTRRPLSQADAYRMIRRRAKGAGIHTKMGLAQQIGEALGRQVGQHLMAEQMRVQRLRNAGLLAIALHNLLDTACRERPEPPSLE